MDEPTLPSAWTRMAVHAVPGAGKTRLLLRLAQRAPGTCLVLAYNNALAREVASRLGDAAEGRLCLTFHALCARCLAPAHDDAQLARAVQSAERGELVPRDVPRSDLLLIDEAQDVRDVYARLVRVLGLVAPHTRVVVAGDKHQLVYSFDPAFPATLDTLLWPEEAFGGDEWEREALLHSHRLTRPMAALVNAVFGTEIEAARDGPPVEVRGRRSLRSTTSSPTWSRPPRPRGRSSCSSTASGQPPLRDFERGVASRQARPRARRRRGRPRRGRRRVRHVLERQGPRGRRRRRPPPRARARNPTYVALTRARAARRRPRPQGAARRGGRATAHAADGVARLRGAIAASLVARHASLGAAEAAAASLADDDGHARDADPRARRARASTWARRRRRRRPSVGWRTSTSPWTTTTRTGPCSPTTGGGGRRRRGRQRQRRR